MLSMFSFMILIAHHLLMLWYTSYLHHLQLFKCSHRHHKDQSEHASDRGHGHGSKGANA